MCSAPNRGALLVAIVQLVPILSSSFNSLGRGPHSLRGALWYLIITRSSWLVSKPPVHGIHSASEAGRSTDRKYASAARTSLKAILLDGGCGTRRVAGV